jgi:hypothetical protein
MATPGKEAATMKTEDRECSADNISSPLPLPPLESRRMSSGFASRTLENLDFIKRVSITEEVHPVTQVVNSLLGLLVFPVEKEEAFFKTFSTVTFKDPSNLSGVRSTLIKHLPVPSLKVVMFGCCKNLSEFFRKVRNAVSHKNLWFSGDADSRVLGAVTVTLKDRPYTPKSKPPADFDWEMSMTAEDLEKLSRYIADEIIRQRL